MWARQDLLIIIVIRIHIGNHMYDKTFIFKQQSTCFLLLS